MSSKPTLRDIAEATGVSTASVSMILNGKSLERFSSQRVASVLAEAERIGYRTPSARCSGKQIAVLSPSVSNPYHTKMITGIDAAAHAAGYHTAIYNTYWNPRTESHLLDSLDYSRVAGIIFAMTPIQTVKVRELSRRVPIVAVGDRVADCGIDTVDVDNFGAAQLVAKHLIDLGHKRIAYLSTALNEHHISRMRRAEGLQEAYRLWCPEGSVTICSHVNSLEAEITTPDLEYRSGMELAYKCLRNDKITGIVAINDMVAFGVLDALQRVEHAEGHHVIDGDDAGDLVVAQAFVGQLHARAVLEVGRGDLRLEGVDVRADGHAALRTPEAVGLLQPFGAAHAGDVVLVERRGQVGDALVAEVDEVLGHELRRAEVVHVHGVDATVRDAVADGDDGHTAAQLAYLDRLDRRHGEDDAGHARIVERVEQVALRAGIPVGVVDRGVIPGGVCCRVDAGDHLGVVGVGDRRREDGNLLAGAAGGRRAVADALGLSQNARHALRGKALQRFSVEDHGDARGGNTGRLGDVAQGGLAAHRHLQ